MPAKCRRCSRHIGTNPSKDGLCYQCYNKMGQIKEKKFALEWYKKGYLKGQVSKGKNISAIRKYFDKQWADENEDEPDESE